MKERVINAFNHFWDAVIDRVPEITIGVVMLAVFIVTGIVLRRFAQRRLLKRLGDQLLANFIGRVIFLVFLVVGIVIFLNQLGLSRAAGGLLAGAGVSALIIGFAFKDIGENLLSGFFLAFSRPFRIGDIIQVEGFTGSVKALSFRNTHIRTFDGRDIFIPNSILIKQPLINFTRDGLMRHDFVVGLDYGDDIAQATTVILNELSKMQNITNAEGLEPFVIINDFGTSTINLKIHFWINTFDFLGSTTVLKSTVMQQVVNRLIIEGFNMPADIIELKIYQEGQPIPVAVKGDNYK
ncbi:mechanosensitive ion channel family protein [Fulvivirga sediminis]|uniref:Mechanosensitive ion channel n=1 Tax=Fulvivirga sediminis TaxID=2803949 RepID=A0A937F7L0_9BACT|nr:mechanosensitive ion channel domain-containing protein [Fulvivirga sediminis]MBL3655458.1 mechanosensitive ion channel [Fulvivirga sediminis]